MLQKVKEKSLSGYKELHILYLVPFLKFNLFFLATKTFMEGDSVAAENYCYKSAHLIALKMPPAPAIPQGK